MGTGIDTAALAGLRQAVDRVDERLVALLAERFRLSGQIAALKGCGVPVTDKARSLDVLERVERIAAGQGLPPHVAGPVWTTIMALSIGHQLACMDGRGDRS